MSRDSHGNPSQPHYVFASWPVSMCRRSTYLNLCRKNLGIASVGLKELTQSLNGWEVPSKCPLAGWDGPSESLNRLGDPLIESLKG